MEKMIYLNIGNTNTQVFSDHGVKTITTNALVDCSLLYKILQIERDEACIFIVSSVVPKASLALQRTFTKAEFKFITWEMLSWIDFSDVDPTTIGADRLANLAAVSNLKLPAMVIDFGTAITTEVLSADFKFLGGNILPGRQLSRLALEQHTAQLPKTPLTLEEPPVLGTTTVEAIQTVDSMTIGGIVYLMNRTQDLFKTKLHIYATGGDAPYFCKCFPDLMKASPELTLEGLKEIQRRLIRR